MVRVGGAAGLRGKLPSWINLPPSVTVPFSCFEESLKQAENKQLAKRLDEAIAAIPPTNAEAQLQVVRDICMEVRDPPPFWCLEVCDTPNMMSGGFRPELGVLRYATTRTRGVWRLLAEECWCSEVCDLLF